MPQEQKDKMGRFLADHISDISSNCESQRKNVFLSVRELNRLGWRVSSESVKSAISSGNNELFLWLTARGAYQNDRSSPNVAVPEGADWVAVHSRNSRVLTHVHLSSEHFEQVALENDTTFLGRMWSSLSKDEMIDTNCSVDSRSFHYLLSGDIDASRDGFRWLARHGMVHLDDSDRMRAIKIYGRSEVAQWP